MFLQKLIIGVATLALMVSAPEFAAALQSPQASQEGQSAPTQADAPQQAQTQDVTDKSPASGLDVNALPDAPSATQAAQVRSDAAQPPRQDGQQPSQEPTGTAAAKSGSVRGGAASKPAGAAIAPAKQRQRRSLLIKLGLLAGAGVAIGTVAALSKGSPSSPPGSR